MSTRQQVALHVSIDVRKASVAQRLEHAARCHVSPRWWNPSTWHRLWHEIRLLLPVKIWSILCSRKYPTDRRREEHPSAAWSCFQREQNQKAKEREDKGALREDQESLSNFMQHQFQTFERTLLPCTPCCTYPPFMMLVARRIGTQTGTPTGLLSSIYTARGRCCYEVTRVIHRKSGVSGKRKAIKYQVATFSSSTECKIHEQDMSM